MCPKARREEEEEETKEQEKIDLSLQNTQQFPPSTRLPRQLPWYDDDSQRNVSCTPPKTPIHDVDENSEYSKAPCLGQVPDDPSMIDPIRRGKGGKAKARNRLTNPPSSSQQSPSRASYIPCGCPCTGWMLRRWQAIRYWGR